MKRLTHEKLLPLMLLVLSGCAAPITQNVKFDYFATESKQGALAAGGLGLLPVVANAGQEGLRRPFGNKLNNDLSNKLPEGKFIGDLETIALISNAGLTEDYSRLLNDYNHSAILNKDSLIKIGAVIGVEHLLYVELLEQSQTEGLAPRILSKDPLIVKEIKMNIFGQVWSCTIGDVVWEGRGEISVQTKDQWTYKQAVDEWVNMAARSILKNLTGLEIPPSTNPKISKKKEIEINTGSESPTL